MVQDAKQSIDTKQNTANKTSVIKSQTGGHGEVKENANNVKPKLSEPKESFRDPDSHPKGGA